MAELYLLARDSGMKEFFLDREEAVERKEGLEEKFPPEELGLVLLEIAVEEVD